MEVTIQSLSDVSREVEITATTEEQTAGMYQIVETTKKLDALVLTLKNSIEQFEI